METDPPSTTAPTTSGPKSTPTNLVCYEKEWRCFGVNPADPVDGFPERSSGATFYVDNQDGVTLAGTTDSFEIHATRAGVLLTFYLLKSVGGSEYEYTVYHELSHTTELGLNSIKFRINVPDDIRIAFEHTGSDEVPIPYANNKIDGTDYNSLMNPTVSGTAEGRVYTFPAGVSVSRRYMFRLCMNINTDEIPCPSGPSTAAPETSTAAPSSTADPNCPAQCPAGPPGPPGPPGAPLRRRRQVQFYSEQQSQHQASIGQTLVPRDNVEVDATPRIHLGVGQHSYLTEGRLVQFFLYILNPSGTEGVLRLEVWRPQGLLHTLVHQVNFTFDHRTSGLIKVPVGGLPVRRGDRLGLGTSGVLPVTFDEDRVAIAPCRLETSPVKPGASVRFMNSPVRTYSVAAVVEPQEAAETHATGFSLYEGLFFAWQFLLTIAVVLISVALLRRRRKFAEQEIPM